MKLMQVQMKDKSGFNNCKKWGVDGEEIFTILLENQKKKPMFFRFSLYKKSHKQNLFKFLSLFPELVGKILLNGRSDKTLEH